jgi:hypothetical protein
MSAINWNSALGGDWSVGTNWEMGLVPASTDNTQITLPRNYTVSITSHVSAASLAINAVGATLAESSAGLLTLSGGLSLYNGVVSLNGANSFGGAVQLIGGVIAVGNGGALGNGDVLLSGGELLATTTQTMTTSMAFSGAPTIAAAKGQTLSLQGSAQLSGPTTLTFGAPGEARDNSVEANILPTLGRFSRQSRHPRWGARFWEFRRRPDRIVIGVEFG